MQIRSNNKNNTDRKSSVFENIIWFSNKANILTFFKKIFSISSQNAQGHLKLALKNCLKVNRSPAVQHLHRATVMLFMGGHKIGRKHREEGEEKSRR